MERVRPACLVCVWRISYKQSKERLFMFEEMFQTKGAAVSSTNCAEKSSYPLVLLSLQSPSLLLQICTMKNMYEYVCKCTYLSLSTDFQKIILLNASITPLCKGMTLFSSEHSAVLFAFFILFKITLSLFFSPFFQHSK